MEGEKEKRMLQRVEEANDKQRWPIVERIYQILLVSLLLSLYRKNDLNNVSPVSQHSRYGSTISDFH